MSMLKDRMQIDNRTCPNVITSGEEIDLTGKNVQSLNFKEWKDSKKDREIWINDDFKHEYFETDSMSNGGKFLLCQAEGSLSSIKAYSNRDEAIEDGWRIKNVRE